jgi:hypothetical protein
VLLAQGRPDRALPLLDRLHAAAISQDRIGSVIEAGALRALALTASGDDAAAVNALLIVIAPGIERFEYFRHLARIATGQQPPESLLEDQARYDTFFDNSPAWRRARSARPGS